MKNKSKTLRRSCFNLPQENIKQIVAVVKNQTLISALEDVAEKEGAQLCLIRPMTPDLIVFNGNIRIVDREYLGETYWNIFCEFLSQVNKEEEFPIKDDDGNVLMETPSYDTTPILIVDENTDTRNFIPPKYALGIVDYINQNAIGLVKKRVQNILQKSPYPISSMVRAVRDEEEKGKRLY